MQSLIAAPSSAALETFIPHLASRFTTASLDRKAGNRFDAVTRGAQRLQSLGQADAKRADQPCGNDSDAGWLAFHV
jgi:hypothetical protein